MKDRLNRAAAVRMTVIAILVVVIALLCFRLHFNLSSATSVHLLFVVLIALRFGLLEASFASVIAAGCLDYFFTDPLFHLSMDDTRNWVALITFEAAAMLIATLSNRATARALEAEVHRAQLDRMYALSQSILLLDRNAAVEQRLAELMHTSLQVEGVVLWNASSARLGRSGVCSLNDEQMRSIDGDEDGASSRRTLRMGAVDMGMLALSGHAFDARSVDAIATLASIALERAQSFHSEASALAAKQSEQLRSAILDGLAHSFKSPLTAILGSSSGLLAMNTLAGTERSLVTLIDQQATSLTALTNHLLLTARLDTEEVTLRTRTVDLREFLEQSLKTSSSLLNGHLCTLETSACEVPIAEVDERLLDLALIQILDNAAKYGSPRRPISVALRESPTHLNIAICNHGSYISLEEREKVFERFYRGEGTATRISGTGIGLAVVRRIAEAHGGHASVTSDRANGTTFTIALPVLSRVAHEAS